jgi:hypothetical protein
MASLYKRNGVYYVAINLEGKRVYQSTRTTRKSEALQVSLTAQDEPSQAHCSASAGISGGPLEV